MIKLLIGLFLALAGCQSSAEGVEFKESRKEIRKLAKKTKVRNIRLSSQRAKRKIKCLESFLKDVKAKKKNKELLKDWVQPPLEEYQNNGCSRKIPKNLLSILDD